MIPSSLPFKRNQNVPPCHILLHLLVTFSEYIFREYKGCTLLLPLPQSKQLYVATEFSSLIDSQGERKDCCTCWNVFRDSQLSKFNFKITVQFLLAYSSS